MGSSSSFLAGSGSCGGLSSYWAGGELKLKVKRKKGQRELNSAVPSPSWCRGTVSAGKKQPCDVFVCPFCLSLLWQPGCGEYWQPCCLFLLLPFVVDACPPECPSAWKGAAEATRQGTTPGLGAGYQDHLVRVFCQVCLSKHKFIERVDIIK